MTTTAIVLLSKDDYYLGPNGELPKRPTWDKQFVTKLIAGKNVLCSPNTLRTIPNSMLLTAQNFTIFSSAPWDINFGIKTFKEAPADVFYIVRSTEALNGGKHFDYQWLTSNYTQMLNLSEFEIWHKNTV